MARKTAPTLAGFAEFEVLAQLAETEMASVYKGRCPATGKLVAIKVAGPAVANNPVLRSRFDQEFAVTRNLDHPYLVRALRLGNRGEDRFMVLEYVDGPSLGDRIEQEGRLPEGEAVRIIAQVAQALHHAHQNRVIHRDVKPDNILLTPEGNPKLADLGLAKDCEANHYLTRPSSGLGTPNFMAPEQFSDARNADRRCDVYSLGATLYMAITGELPFRGKGMMHVLKKKLTNELVPPRQFVPDLSRCVESTILRAVDVNPQVRHASCLEFVEELVGGGPAGPEMAPAAPRARKIPHAQLNGRQRRAAVRYSSTKGGSCRPLREEKVCWEATIQDISIDGAALILNRRFEPRTVLSLELAATPQEPGMRLLVRVVRVEQVSARRWLLGCLFANRLSDDEVVAMQ